MLCFILPLVDLINGSKVGVEKDRAILFYNEIRNEIRVSNNSGT